ncbi:MAG: SUMF1/EgtB/PvdO family nonheme iron enzyme [Rhodocyclaceae bacterium]|nr:SUMF1/EgtB/PvdO family nonheme iron enzyme [Rhodocyclaceae bacterium]
MTTDYSIATRARTANAATLTSMLQDTRQLTLALLDAYVQALGPALRIPYAPELNPPLWEVGHVAWFQDYWLARNPERARGLAANPECARPPGREAQADGWYDSSRVAHTARWSLPLPDLTTTCDYLAASLQESLALLADDGQRGADPYFYQLALFHEDMHAEAACYMAQTLDIALPATLMRQARQLPLAYDIHLAAQSWTLGGQGVGFAFDNELPVRPQALARFAIDSVPVTWRRFLPPVEAGCLPCPAYLRRRDGEWQARCYGSWQTLDLDTAAEHLTQYEAQAWCDWAGRRLPSEVEWECAALSASGFHWGEVWEWTGSRFAPFPGFVAHPYRDYSRFGFDEQRPVLKGASRATHPRMAHPKYRNYFPAQRFDMHSGFRSCAL